MDDFLYLCDDAYTHDDLLNMERDILHELDYDINIPIAYRFLRRLARVRTLAIGIHVAVVMRVTMVMHFYHGDVCSDYSMWRSV